jgi:hypothetical protein
MDYLPHSPKIGDKYLDLDISKILEWDGSMWIELNALPSDKLYKLIDGKWELVDLKQT